MDVECFSRETKWSFNVSFSFSVMAPFPWASPLILTDGFLPPGPTPSSSLMAPFPWASPHLRPFVTVDSFSPEPSKSGTFEFLCCLSVQESFHEESENSEGGRVRSQDSGTGCIPSGSFSIPSVYRPTNISIPESGTSSFYLTAFHTDLHSIGGRGFQSSPPSIMGFLIIPRLLLHPVVLVTCTKSAIWWALQFVGLAELLEPETSSSSALEVEAYYNPSVQDEMIREWLPVTTFGEFAQRFQGEIGEDGVCAVCLSRLEEEDEMRELCNCFHVFHRNCLEKWLHQRQTTCPLCRCCLLPDPERERADTMLLQSSQSWLLDTISFLFSEDLAVYRCNM